MALGACNCTPPKVRPKRCLRRLLNGTGDYALTAPRMAPREHSVSAVDGASTALQMVPQRRLEKRPNGARVGRLNRTSTALLEPLLNDAYWRCSGAVNVP